MREHDPPPGAFVLRHAVRVGYVDTDQGGVVHHSTYLRWLEQARVEYLRARGVVYRALELDQKYALPVAEQHVRYRTPARFDEELSVACWVGKLGRASVRFDYTVWRSAARVCDAEVMLACVELPSGRMRTLPDGVRAACSDGGV